MITRRGMLAGILAGTALPVWAEGMDSSVRPRPKGQGQVSGGASAPAAPVQVQDAEALVTAAKLTGTVGFVVADAATGKVLEARAPETAMPPASVAKAVTSLFALERLGAGHRYVTRVLATGPIEAGVLKGDLVLAGGGDPTLETDQLGDLAARLAKSGLKRVTGRFLAADGALPRMDALVPDQPVQVGYNPGLSGLNLNFNRVYFEWKKSGGDWTVGMDARGARFVPAVNLVRMAVKKRQSPLYTYDRGPEREDWTVASGALGTKGGSRWLPVRLTGRYTAEVFRTLARAQGIDLPAVELVAAAPKGREIGRIESEALPAILRSMLKFSTNLTAECNGLTASGAGTLARSGTAMSDWARQNFGVDARFVDHSGLGGASRISAADMVKILSAAHVQGRGLKPLLRDVGMKDDKGAVIKGHPVKVVAKSGTLNFVSGLAGHITPPAGREMVFAIFTGDPTRRDAVPVAARERPEGVEAWIKRSRRLQGQLISRWAGLYA
ncbi:D-alanyl-D-alanine carboxypeptidase/D-alanyl-D-alanine endopeptidase [Xinfangfangia pollutisoli]|uniref:D-alanyl-D-alanine carboxypeptidase/D-alanyl-D-alanine endopeptidase n=1 Tax=Xinfangfangia pollutisoli TaxID=2865960 RepID=UPI00296F773B|nr:D-alanyl-D-alanine carboxypeptidase/D-alanyl-D-alanine-endopeptidase [Xinfangfangia pollutisoli]